MKHLNKSHRAILDALTEQPLTKLELKLITGQSPSGLRGRITEMRKFGYDIRSEEPKKPIKKYHLISKPPENVDKILEWLKEKNLFGDVVCYSTISKELDISVEDVGDAMAEIFKTHFVVQMSKDSVKVKKVVNA